MKRVPHIEDLCAGIGFWPYEGLEFQYYRKTIKGKKITLEEGKDCSIDYRCSYPVVISAVTLLHPLVDQLLSGERSQIVIQTERGITIWVVSSNDAH